MCALNNGETTKTPGPLGREGEQNDHVTDAHQLVTKTTEGAEKMKGVHQHHQVIESLFIQNVMLYIAINGKVVKSLKSGDEPFRRAGGPSEMPACGGELWVYVYAWAALLPPSSTRKLFWAIYILYGWLFAL